MKKTTSLNRKLVIQTLFATVVPLILLIIFFSAQSVKTTNEAKNALLETAGADLEHMASNFYAEAGLAKVMLEANIIKVGSYAQSIVEKHGGIKANESETEQWNAIDQVTKLSASISLPRLYIGEEWLGHVTNVSQSVPVVDEVRDISGDTATVFQRMNDAGDMLRVATSVVGKDGNRAVGTYISARAVDGSANKVISTVLSGNDYVGRAFVVDRWYQTAYKPIKDADGKIIGMLYVGTPEEVATADFRKRMQDMVVGKDGYVFIINTKGADRGRYELSKGGKRDGEIVLNTKDSDGKMVISDMISAVEKAGKGDVVSFTYSWKNGNEPERVKMAKLVYFEAWDWMVGVSTYEDDFLGTVRDMQASSRSSIIQALIFSCIFAAIACFLVAFVIRRTVKKVEVLTLALRTGAQETGSAASDVSRASEDLAAGASEQASGIEETSATINELTAQTHSNTESAGKARDLMHATASLVDAADARMKTLNESMQEIARVSAETQKIVKTIDEIAFQTNILALNAAVEAARAGESGAGFAVVANEVRNLAQRAAEAAQNTGNLIGDSTSRIAAGCEMSKSATEAFALVRDKTTSVTEIVSQIAEASADQQTGHDQIEKAIGEMNTVVQRNAAAAEESAAAAEELSSQSEMLLTTVAELNEIIEGTDSHLKAMGQTDKSRQVIAGTPQRKLAQPVQYKPKSKSNVAKGGFLPAKGDTHSNDGSEHHGTFHAGR